jgi:hypothetical protein
MNARLTADQESECAIYAEGTQFSSEELKAAFRAHILECKDSGREPERVQDWLESYLEQHPDLPSVSIRNINERYGDPVTWTADTLDAAVAAMQADVRLCGPEFADVVVTDADYEIVTESDDAE